MSLVLAGLLLCGVIAGGAPFLSAAALIPAGLLLGIIGLTIYYFPRVRVFQFVNTSGLIVLDVFESGPERHRAEEFAQLIASTIRNLRSSGQLKSCIDER
jgi:hypothetical protein